MHKRSEPPGRGRLSPIRKGVTWGEASQAARHARAQPLAMRRVSPEQPTLSVQQSRDANGNAITAPGDQARKSNAEQGCEKSGWYAPGVITHLDFVRSRAVNHHASQKTVHNVDRRVLLVNGRFPTGEPGVRY